MKYRILLHEEGATPLELKTRVLLATDDLNLITAVEDVGRRAKPAGAVQSVFSAPPQRPGPKGRKVYITEVEEGSGTSLERGDVFDNARELSTVLGISYNAVALKLAEAKRKGETRATLNGVEFQYLDDMVGVD